MPERIPGDQNRRDDAEREQNSSPQREFERKFRKIPETSEEYIEDRRIFRDIASQPGWAVFGAEAISASEPMRLPPSIMPEPEEEKRMGYFKEKLARELRQCRRDIASAAKDRKSEIVMRGFFQEALGDEIIASELAKIKLPKRPNIPKPSSEYLMLARIFDPLSKDIAERARYLRLAINIDAIPDELLLKMLALHLKRFERRKEELERNLPNLEDIFRERLEAAIANGSLPITREIAEQRLAAISVFFQDEITAKLSEIYGQYDTELSRVLIAEQVPDDKLDEVYAHEMVHALGGKTILETAYREIGDAETVHEFGNPDIAHLRQGFRFESDWGDKVVFNWLNEALTENISKKIVETRNHLTYGLQRKLLSLLMERGARPIPERLFIETYFESYDPSRPIEERIPAWKALNGEIGAAYEPGFLPALDRYVRKHGVKATVEAMEQDWRKIKTPT